MASLCSPAVHSSVPLFIRYQTCEHDTLKKNEPDWREVGSSGPRENEMKRSTLGVRASRIKVTECRSYIWRRGSGIIFDPCLQLTSFSSSILFLNVSALFLLKFH